MFVFNEILWVLHIIKCRLNQVELSETEGHTSTSVINLKYYLWQHPCF